jgi:hypothetical protein
MPAAMSSTMLGHVSAEQSLMLLRLCSMVPALSLACNSDAMPLPYLCPAAGSAQDICAVADKVLTFIDMGGHQRCLKTALWVPPSGCHVEGRLRHSQAGARLAVIHTGCSGCLQVGPHCPASRLCPALLLCKHGAGAYGPRAPGCCTGKYGVVGVLSATQFCTLTNRFKVIPSATTLARASSHTCLCRPLSCLLQWQ